MRRSHYWHRIFTGEKCLRMRRDTTWSISGKVIGLEATSARNVVNMKEEMAAIFFLVVVLWFCCYCERSKTILVEIFSDMRCLIDNAALNCHTNTLARSI